MNLRAVTKPMLLLVPLKGKMGKGRKRDERCRRERRVGGKRAHKGEKGRKKEERQRKKKGGRGIEREKKAGWFPMAFQSVILFPGLTEDLQFFALKLHLSTILRNF